MTTMKNAIATVKSVATNIEVQTGVITTAGVAWQIYLAKKYFKAMIPVIRDTEDKKLKAFYIVASVFMGGFYAMNIVTSIASWKTDHDVRKNSEAIRENLENLQGTLKAEAENWSNINLDTDEDVEQIIKDIKESAKPWDSDLID